MTFKESDWVAETATARDAKARREERTETMIGELVDWVQNTNQIHKSFYTLNEVPSVVHQRH